jgi:hypothetical protein
MKLSSLAFILVLIIYPSNFQAQGCLPNGITFSNQQQVDNFATNYPGCTEILGDVIINYGISNVIGLSQITSIQGKLTITNGTLNNLTGLNNLTNIGSDTKIKINSASSFTGLENLQSIGGFLEITDCTSLNNLSSLESLTSIDGYLLIEDNHISEIGGLNNLISLSGDLSIQDNPNLTTVNGLANLPLISGNLSIIENPSLMHPNGFANLTTINGNFELNYNDGLINLLGFNALTNIGGNLKIFANPSLSNFDGLNNLEIISGGVDILANDSLTNFQGFDSLYATGTDQFDRFNVVNNESLINFIGLDNINNISEFRISDNVSMQDLEGLNTLEIVGPGNLTISGKNLTNLEGLDNLKSIGWEFMLLGNDELINLIGLNNLETVGGGFDIIDNPVFQNFEGLESLSSIGGIYIDACYQLEDFSGLENLVDLNNGLISVTNRNNLVSLNGIQNIEYTTIDTIDLRGIDTLSDCSLPNICTYLYNYGTAYISQNASGCENVQDILDHCEPLSVNDENPIQNIVIFPNPTNDFFEIQSTTHIERVQVYTTLGSKAKEFRKSTIYNISDLSPGIYILILETENGRNVSKFIKN